jgi:hypothetical protein
MQIYDFFFNFEKGAEPVKKCKDWQTYFDCICFPSYHNQAIGSVMILVLAFFSKLLYKAQTSSLDNSV